MNISNTIANAKPSFVITEAQTKLEAIGLMLSGLWYFLEHNTKITLAVLLVMSGSSLTLVAIGYLYVKSDSITVQRATPISKSDIEFNGTMMPMAIAGVAKGNSIIIEGKLYGFSDPHFVVWKLMNENAILIYDKKHGDVLRAETDVFSEQSIEQKIK